MQSKSWLVGFGAGLIVGVVAVIGLTSAGHRAEAQVDLRAHRYQISSWSHPAGSLGVNSGGNSAEYGAYILDENTGKVWIVNGIQKPKSLGTVE